MAKRLQWARRCWFAFGAPWTARLSAPLRPWTGAAGRGSPEGGKAGRAACRDRQPRPPSEHSERRASAMDAPGARGERSELSNERRRRKPTARDGPQGWPVFGPRAMDGARGAPLSCGAEPQVGWGSGLRFAR